MKEIQRLFKNFPEDTKELDNMRLNLQEWQKSRWTENWNSKVLPLLLHSIDAKTDKND